MTYLLAHTNPYNGIVIDGHTLPNSPEEFKQQLQLSLAHWQNAGHATVWLTILLPQAHLIPHVLAAGFDNHHSHQHGFTFTKALIEHALIPHFATHTIGVGGLVINNKQQLLTIREQDHIHTHPHNWKFPGGMLDPKEHIHAGVIREVFEETGIQTQFERLLGCRHYHKGQFNTSNIYIVCLLTPLNHEIVLQASEIADARWMDINEYLNDEKIGAYNKAILKSALNDKGLQPQSLPSLSATADELEIYIG